MSVIRIGMSLGRHLLGARSAQLNRQLIVQRYEIPVMLRMSSTRRDQVMRIRKWSATRLSMIGILFGASLGTSYSLYKSWKNRNLNMERESIPPQIIDKFPNVKITKRYVNANDASGLDIVLFQFQTCPFCCKVRAFLDYMAISYSVVEVDAVLRQDIKWSNTNKVPMVLIRQQDGRYVKMSDSSAIISLLSTYLNDVHQDIGELAKLYPLVSYYDENGKCKYDIMNKYFPMYGDHVPKDWNREHEELERKWRVWADNLLVHLISPNCYRTLAEARETFEWFSQAGEWSVHFPKWERDLMVNIGALAMWAISKMLKRRHGLSEDVRSDIYEAIEKWTFELEKRNIQFLSGKKPNLADLSIYGVLNSMEGCRAFEDCLANTKIGPWYYRVQEFVLKNRGTLVRERIEGSLPADRSIALSTIEA